MSNDNKSGNNFALYEYTNSTNIGDEIQSIAARRFLPEVNFYINRDDVGRWIYPISEEETSGSIDLIANGWYMSGPFSWPIQEPRINPLLISMHIEEDITNVKNAFSSLESVEYLKKYQPVGCRDKPTEKFLNSIGIETFFSGCLTLTLQRDAHIEKQDYILLSGVGDDIYQKIKQQTDRTVIRVDSHSESVNSFLTAEKYLFLYQSAYCVVTSRLHAMLPSLALETPVLFISDGQMTASNSRFKGYETLTHNLSEQEYISKPSRYDVNNPPVNPRGYEVLRAELIKRCSEFTGYDNKKTFARDINFANFSPLGCLDLIIYNQDYLGGVVVRDKENSMVELKRHNLKLQAELQSSRKLIKRLATNTGYYFTRIFFHK